MPSRRAFLCSSLVHGAALIACAVFGAAAATHRPHAVVQVQDTRAALPPSAPATPVPEVAREPVRDAPLSPEPETADPDFVQPAEPAPASPPEPRDRRASFTPTLERVVRREPAPPPQAPPPPAAPAEVAPSPALSVESRSEPSAYVPATPRADNRPPAYPLEARRRGHGGEVVLAVRVDAGGAVAGLEVAVSSGHAALDRAAVRAVSRWRFEPARVGGVAIATETTVAVEFRLDG